MDVDDEAVTQEVDTCECHAHLRMGDKGSGACSNPQGKEARMAWAFSQLLLSYIQPTLCTPQQAGPTIFPCSHSPLLFSPEGLPMSTGCPRRDGIRVCPMLH